MPRLQPPPGFTTAGRAAAKLGISEALLSRYVKDGKIKRYGPEERKHKFYKISEIDALLETERMFPDEAYKRGDYKKNPISTFERATDLDMSAIIDISHAIFGDAVIPAEIRLTWLHRNPDTFYVVKDHKGIVKSYASLLPLKRATIEQIIRDELEVETIPPNEIEQFTPGETYHLYVMAIGTDPRIQPKRERYEYSARMINGLFNFFLELAQHGIEIETITARSHKADGLRLLRKIGIPQLHSPVPGKALFALRVSESGFYIFERYNELLTEWKGRQKAPTLPSSPYVTRQTPQRQQGHEINVMAPERAKKTPAQKSLESATSPPPSGQEGQRETLPEGWITPGMFAKQHAIKREASINEAIREGRLNAHEGRWKQERATARYALDREQQRQASRLFASAPNFRQCDDPDCPCHE